MVSSEGGRTPPFAEAVGSAGEAEDRAVSAWAQRLRQRRGGRQGKRREIFGRSRRPLGHDQVSPPRSCEGGRPGLFGRPRGSPRADLSSSAVLTGVTNSAGNTVKAPGEAYSSLNTSHLVHRLDHVTARLVARHRFVLGVPPFLRVVPMPCRGGAKRLRARQRRLGVPGEVLGPDPAGAALGAWRGGAGGRRGGPAVRGPERLYVC